MREHRLIFAVLALSLMAFFVVASTPVKATDRSDVRMFIWNKTLSSNTYPFKAYPTTTLVTVWIDAPNAWTNTVQGIVSWKARLQVDPAVVEVMGAAAWPDGDGDLFPDDFLGLFLSQFHPEWSLGVLYPPVLVDKVAGTIEAAEAIGGFDTLAVGAGGNLYDPLTFEPLNEYIPLTRFSIRTKSGVTTGGSMLSLTGIYVTLDSVEHPVEVVEGGIYGTVVPEFPFGIGILMMIVPAFAVMYLWRTRKKVTKP